MLMECKEYAMIGVDEVGKNFSFQTVGDHAIWLEVIKRCTTVRQLMMKLFEK